MSSHQIQAAVPYSPRPNTGLPPAPGPVVPSFRHFNAADVRAAVPWEKAISALELALLSDVDPELDDARLFSPAPEGEFLLMPSSNRSYCGVKALTVAPMNPQRGLEKIQGVYILFDSVTLAPLATFDGTEITAIRTPAVTLLALKYIVNATPEGQTFPDAPRILVFGAGVQALNHIRAAKHIFKDATFVVVGRRPERVAALVQELAHERIVVTAGSDADVPESDIIICATTATEPLFGGDKPKAGAIIATVGQHGLGVREVDSTLVLRSDVVVEGRESAWREAGDLIPARSVEEWQRIHPHNLRELVRGELQRTPGKTCLYNGVGMSWQDLVTAAVVYEGS
ncbi:ornithine cyclodeaminase family protein [Arthrobacter sp. efr-133-TYG-118]|uniref:ornithine cyclodeaminase family protein n=1 Tax=Arthrobacter sp. efr-133-TYG-118 TaxID=3040279 RepID=UPI00254FED0D|nr:ornithine cyclodeaminase family protein [Arthrobacter sp. efr-133-TYG-118]